MLKITVSFKQTTRDIKIYNTINNQEEKSDFVKKAVEYYLEQTSIKTVSTTDNS